MCAIFGALVFHHTHLNQAALNGDLDRIWLRSHDRGRDGRGWLRVTSDGQTFASFDATWNETGFRSQAPRVTECANSTAIIGNLRAEPTTEFVELKTAADQQPYTCGQWSMVHNGTVANDKELRTGQVRTSIDSAAIVEQLAIAGAGFNGFIKALNRVKGSFAILAIDHTDPGKLYAAANYRPIWYVTDGNATYFASSREYLKFKNEPRMLRPYTAACFGPGGAILSTLPLYPEWPGIKALVVCSGGLDSVVSAAYAKRMLDMDIELIHFLYGSRAEGPEVQAVQAVAENLGVPVHLFPLPIYRKQDSPLLDPDSEIAGGEAGAEFASEWVPARNLLLLSVATAFAEARGFETLVLGNNLEEAGAYPDNEPEFISKFNDLLPFAVGAGKRMRVIMPVGNLMKHEIVRLGNEINAPMHLTWSCYRAGEKHCGKCGPCYMRRTAFMINKLQETIDYMG